MGSKKGDEPPSKPLDRFQNSNCAIYTIIFFAKSNYFLFTIVMSWHPPKKSGCSLASRRTFSQKGGSITEMNPMQAFSFAPSAPSDATQVEDEVQRKDFNKTVRSIHKFGTYHLYMWFDSTQS